MIDPITFGKSDRIESGYLVVVFSDKQSCTDRTLFDLMILPGLRQQDVALCAATTLCSPNRKEEFGRRILTRSSIYQEEFRGTKYRTETKHVMKVTFPKCNTSGYPVRYTVKKKETEG